MNLKVENKMAFSQVTKDLALQHFIEGKSLAQISNILNVPLKTLYNWKYKYDWASFLRIGNIEIAMSVEQEMYRLVQTMINNNTIGDPAQVDKLVKLTKALERLSPNRQILNSLYRILEAITDYVNLAQDPIFAKSWQKHLKPLSQHLKKVFSPKD
mgnify:CR=1 FL=1|jgi:hypothetical protein